MSTRTLLPGFLDRAAITLLTGASHAGKTTLLAQLVKAIYTDNTIDRVFLGLHVPTCSVSYVIAGDAKPWQDTLDTFTDIGATLDPARVSTSLEYPVHNPHTSTDLLLSTLSDLPPSDLYIVEGLVTFISPISVINYHGPVAGLRQLAQWAQGNADPSKGPVRLPCAVLGTHHLGKPDAGDKLRRPLDRVLGTTALVGNVSHTVILETPEELKSHTHRLTLYHRRSKTQTLYLTREDAPGGPFTLTDRGEADPERAAFLNAIPAAPEAIHIKELYRVASSERTAKRWVEELVVEGKIRRAGKGQYQRA